MKKLCQEMKHLWHLGDMPDYVEVHDILVQSGILGRAALK